jgi:hypothetical protein
MSFSNAKSSKSSEVLFQKLGHRWYVFTEIDNDIVYSALPDGIDPRTTKLQLFDVIEDHLKKVAQVNRKAEVAI